MPNRIGVHRHVATVQQAFRCYYCRAPIWERDPSSFVADHRISRKQAALVRSTAEHLKPRSEGGPNSRANIVAACLYCNTTRHKARKPLAPEAYRARVQRRVASGRWLTAAVFSGRQRRG